MQPKLTPAMQQYVDLKQQYSDCVLLFRLGDFYEVFFEDAKLCAKVLDLVLTARNKTSDNPIPMAGMPHHSADKYIAKLVQQGYKVAIAEQMSEPIPGQVVERKVVSVVTPGTHFEETQRDFSYMLAITESLLEGKSHYHCARGDFSLGEYTTHSVQTLDDLQKLILTLNPSEILLALDFSEKENIHQTVQAYTKSLVSITDVPYDYESFLKRSCGVQTLSSFGKATQEGRGAALAMLLQYIQNTQQSAKLSIVRVGLYGVKDFVLLDDISIKNLEIFQSSYESQEKYSLFGVLDTTRTAAGGRLLRYILAHPSKNEALINDRLDQIAYYLNKIPLTQSIHQQLSQTHDIMRIVSTIVYKKPLPVLFSKLRSTFSILLQDDARDELTRLAKKDNLLTPMDELLAQLQATFVDDDQLTNEANFVRDGFDTEIDELRKIAFHSDDLLLQYQQELVQHSGVTQVKVKFVNNQGYFLEVTNKDIAAFEKSFVEGDERLGLLRRNTLKGAQRYVSPYLDSIQQKVLSAKSALAAKEQAILVSMQESLQSHMIALADFADTVAAMDVYTAFALLAQEKDFVRPEFVRGDKIDIIGGRHPVIETFLPRDEQFIPNDLDLSSEALIHIITGPNMGGKSTFLRQNALLVLMAHCGLRVPAKSMRLGAVDGIFARVGSGDIIAKNQSTFMTEMIEVANILHNATSKSFVIFDELGRGTSTYDGLALTQAILSYIATSLKSKTLIATHYHELIKLEQHFPSVKNFSVSVYETDKDVVFLKKIVAGGADKSYGIDVAKIAGIPAPILDQAKKILGGLTDTSGRDGIAGRPSTSPMPPKSDGLFTPTTVPTVSRTDTQREKIKTLIDSHDLNTMTPLQAFQILVKLQEEVRKL